MIEVRGLSFGYENTSEVLKGIDLRIGRGDFMGVLGPNGSGKTTLLRCLTGTVKPWKGNVRLRGSEVSGMKRRETAKTLAVVPQELDLGFDFTVYETVSMGRYPHIGRFQFHDARGEKVLKGSMHYTGVWNLRKRRVSRLSGGEKQRTMIARALAQEPKVILLDEPTKNLDIRHSLDILELLERMNREQNLTVITIFHDLDLAARFCRRLLLLKDGKVASYGSRSEVITPENIQRVYGVNARIHNGSRTHVEIIG